MESVESGTGTGPTNEDTALATAVAVEDLPVVVADPVEKQEKESKKSNTLLILSLIVAAIVVIVLAVLLSPSGDSMTETETDRYKQRREDMISILGSLYENSEGSLAVFDSSSPLASKDRIEALEWLVMRDESNLTIPVLSNLDNFTKEDKQDYEKMIYQIRQRYVISLLYTATNGEGWIEQYNFLSESDECEWQTITDDQETKGVICNDAGQVDSLVMWWNNMTGTLPHEISFLSESFKAMNIGGGSISGSIPSSFAQLTNMYLFIVNDNCLSGDLPQEMNLIDMPNLEIFSTYQNNYNLKPSPGNMETFCDGLDALAQGVVAVAIDCPAEEFWFDEMENVTRAPYGCDCCVCCEPDKFECAHLPSGSNWKVVFLGTLASDGYPLGFSSQCISEQQESWISENCPCSIDENNNGAQGECTTDCTQEGALPSYDFGSQ